MKCLTYFYLLVWQIKPTKKIFKNTKFIYTFNYTRGQGCRKVILFLLKSSSYPFEIHVYADKKECEATIKLIRTKLPSIWELKSLYAL